MNTGRPRIIYAAKHRGEIIYIGQTLDLPQRVANHKTTAPWCVDGVAFVQIAEVSGANEAKSLEAQLIAEHQPVNNYHHTDRRKQHPIVESDPSTISVAELAAEIGVSLSHARRHLILGDVSPVGRRANVGKGCGPLVYRRSDVQLSALNYGKQAAA